jgi:hypothetical protein
MQADGFEDGYCTEPDCDPDQSDSCTGDATCLDNSVGSNVCLERCSGGGNGDCRNGYDCAETNDGSNVCVPGGTNPGSGYDVGDEWEGYTGDDCSSDSDCVEGTCVETKQFPDGYCSTLHCSGSWECSSEDAHCKNYKQGTDMCMRDCSNGCRNGYTCEGSVCVPDGSTLGSGFEQTRHDLGFLCLPERTGWGSLGPEWTFKFRIDGSASSYMFVPVVTSGTVKATELQTPSRRIDIAYDYKHHNSKWGVDGASGATYGGRYNAISYAWPVLVPYAPNLGGYVRGGGHTLEVTASSERPCAYILEKEQQHGSTIDLNVYAVSNQRSSSSLSNNSDWMSIMNRAETLLQTGGVSFGDVDYRSASGAGSNIAVPNSYDEVAEVSGVGERTGSDLDDYLTIDVVVVDNIKIQRDNREISPLGWVGNTPGAAGLHGNRRNGIVINANEMGSGNRVIAHGLAQRLGHFLGLRHTTETRHNSGDAQEMSNKFGTTDPIQDTPVCSDMDERIDQQDIDDTGSGGQADGKDITGCPDYENLMFPSTPPSNAEFTPSLTDGQEEVLKANPLVKP